ncbi:hypothetical protein DFJ77DRAFT_256971 [Powellomyces hirtus]|nr:hypothetical protein DFJ77DRAFT_256971 [Powellomyces hirtus]
MIVTVPRRANRLTNVLLTQGMQNFEPLLPARQQPFDFTSTRTARWGSFLLNSLLCGYNYNPAQLNGRAVKIGIFTVEILMIVFASSALGALLSSNQATQAQVTVTLSDYYNLPGIKRRKPTFNWSLKENGGSRCRSELADFPVRFRSFCSTR